VSLGITHEIAQEFLSSLIGLPEVKRLMSAEHFSVDGTMLKAWASMKSFRPKASPDGGPGNGPPQVAASLGYTISQRLRKRIEEGFGWGKAVAGLMQVKVRGLAKVRAVFVFAMAAYNIVRLPKLLAPRSEARPAT
jgi:hypothetical protein